MSISLRFLAWTVFGIACTLSHDAAAATIATATANGPVVLEPFRNTTTRLGSGAVAAHARAGGALSGAGATLDPAAGLGFNDVDPIGTIPPPLTDLETSTIGVRLGNIYRDLPPPMGTVNRSLTIGREIVYKVDAVANKTPLRPDQGGNDKLQLKTSATATAGGLTANGDAVMNVGLTPSVAGSYTVTGNASAKITGRGTRGFAVGVLRDPVTFQRTSAGEDGIVDFIIGDTVNPFFLQVSEPGAFAEVFFDLIADDVPLVAFDVYLDFDGVLLTVSEFNAAPGFPKMLNNDPILTDADFAAYFNSLLSYDPTGHTVTTNAALAPNGIPVYRLTLSDDTAVTLSFAAGALVGITPEPPVLALVLLALLPLSLRRVIVRTQRLPQMGDSHGSRH